MFFFLFVRCFVSELDLSGMQVDVALRKFQAYFRMPGEAQKIERLVEVFSRRYCLCNPDLVQRLRTHDTVSLHFRIISNMCSICDNVSFFSDLRSSVCNYHVEHRSSYSEPKTGISNVFRRLHQKS